MDNESQEHARNVCAADAYGGWEHRRAHADGRPPRPPLREHYGRRAQAAQLPVARPPPLVVVLVLQLANNWLTEPGSAHKDQKERPTSGRSFAYGPYNAA